MLGDYHDTTNHKCVACTAGCSNCYHDGTNVICTQCGSGKYLKSGS